MTIAVTDADLILAARTGDAAAAGALLERHRAGMIGAAIAILGWRPDIEDVVQDAMMVGLTNLDAIRDPALAGAWLRSVCRNLALTTLRHERRSILMPDVPEHGSSPSLDQALEDQAIRDWLWSALDRLSAPLREVVVLRYFTGVTSYAAIADLCGIPIGTVRSRLNEARRRLHSALEQTAHSAHADARARTIERTAEAVGLLDAGWSGSFERVLAGSALPDLAIVGPQGQRGRGQRLLVRIMAADAAAGVRQRVRNLAASTDLTVLECDLLSPPSDPGHCPSGVVWLMSLRDERIARIRLFHPVAADDDPTRPNP